MTRAKDRRPQLCDSWRLRAVASSRDPAHNLQVLCVQGVVRRCEAQACDASDLVRLERSAPQQIRHKQKGRRPGQHHPKDHSLQRAHRALLR